jgi:hypothetical protein
MANYRKTRSEEVEDKSRRKKSPRQHQGKVMKAPGEEMASPSAAAEDPVALLTSPEMGHPANASVRAQAMAELQRQRGNIYVQRLIRSGAIQAKLTVNPPDDVYEREADRLAEEVMRGSEPQVQRQEEPEEEEEEILRRKPLTGQATPLAQRQVEPEEEEEEVLRAKPLTGQATPLAQRQVEPDEEEEEGVLRTKPLTGQATPLAQRQVEPEEEEEEEPVEMKRIPGGTPEVSPELEGRIQGLKGGGQALDNKVRAQMESAFGADLSDVRAHANAEADSLARELGAKAFTTGKDIFFSEGSYQPGSESGKKLIGHELTHVVQQARSAVAGPSRTAPAAGRLGPEVAGIAEVLPEKGVLARQIEQEGEPKKELGWLDPSRHIEDFDVDRALNDIGDADDRVRHNANEFGHLVLTAANAFKNYATKRIKTLKGTIPVTELVGALASAALGSIGGAVSARIASEIGKKVCDFVTDQMKEVIKKKTEDASTKEGLQEAVNEIVQGAIDAGLRMRIGVDKHLRPVLKELTNKLDKMKKSEKRLRRMRPVRGRRTAEEMALRRSYQLTVPELEVLKMFYMNRPQWDSLLETHFGVPTMSSSKNTHLRLYYDLVRRFEERYILAEALEEKGFYERTRKRVKSKYEARKRAVEAGKERESELEKGR